MIHGIFTYANGLSNKLWELSCVHLPARGEQRVTSDAPLEVVQGFAVLSASQPHT